MGSFTPCSPRHHSCSPTHAALVAGYRDERRRQEMLRDEITGMYTGDEKHYAATHEPLIDFKQWLIFNKRVS